jgi:LETM1 and EF-hand domain-containing protein 1
LEVSSDSASNKQRLEVLQQQEELIEDEEEQEAKEAEARKLKKEAEEEAKEAESEALRKEKEIADELLPPAEVIIYLYHSYPFSAILMMFTMTGR